MGLIARLQIVGIRKMCEFHDMSCAFVPKRDVKRFKKCGRKKFFYSDCIPINLLIVQLFRKQNEDVNDPFRINDFPRVFLRLQSRSNRNDDRFLGQIQ